MTRLIPALDDAQRGQLISAARAYLGAKFLHQGRTAHGMDCIGLLVLSFRDIGLPLANRTDYGRIPAGQKLQMELERHFGPPVSGEPQPGDVVSMVWDEEACHVAIVTPHPERGIGLIHCYLHAQRVVEHGVDADWRQKVVGVYR